MKAQNKLILLLLFIDIILLVLGFLNLRLFANKPGLPVEYQAEINNFSFDINNAYHEQKIIEFDGKVITRSGLLDYYMLSNKPNDSVRIKSIGSNGEVIDRPIVLTYKYDNLELGIISLVTCFLFFTGIYVLIKYRHTGFAYIIHALSIFTGLMIIIDWGDLITYNKFLNFICFLLFETSIYMVPTLFLHLSFTYPVRNKNMILLAPFYCAAITLIIISYIQITKIFFFGGSITDLNYLSFHTTIADIYLVIVIILTIAKFEHSALTINNITYKKQIYWALSGITFGPLIYVFLCLLPRLLMGHELVSLVFMQFTILIAPIMLLISLGTPPSPDYFAKVNPSPITSDSPAL